MSKGLDNLENLYGIYMDSIKESLLHVYQKQSRIDKALQTCLEFSKQVLTVVNMLKICSLFQAILAKAAAFDP